MNKYFQKKTARILLFLAFIVGGGIFSVWVTSPRKPVVVVIAYGPEVSPGDPLQIDYKAYDVYFLLHDCARTKLEKDSSKIAGCRGHGFIRNFDHPDEVIGSLRGLLPFYTTVDYIIHAENEELVFMAALIREAFHIPGMLPDQAACFVYKDKMKEALQQAGVATIPFTHDITNAPERFGYHLVLKPTNGEGSKGIYIVHSRSEFEGALGKIQNDKGDKWHDYIAEPFIEGDIYNVDGLVQEGEIVCSLPIKGIGNNYDYYRKNQGWGTITVTDRDQRSQLQALAKRLITSLRHRDGGFHIEIMHDHQTGEYLVIEVAARTSGSAYAKALEKHYGFYYCILIYDIQLGIPVTIPENFGDDGHVVGTWQVPAQINIVKLQIENIEKSVPIAQISEISPQGIFDTLNGFSGYRVVNVLKEDLISEIYPKKGDYIGIRSRHFHVDVLLEGTEESVMEDIKALRENFVLKTPLP